ncbi:hypothetical protein OMR07_28140, partial [Methylobacterium organophilum]|nr:hypothetical protein [Methylobacterium organophilum]
AAGLPAGIRRIVAGGTAQRLINRGIDRLPAGPSATAREKARSSDPARHRPSDGPGSYQEKPP